MSGTCGWCGERVTGILAMFDKTIVLSGGRAHFIRQKGLLLRFDSATDEETQKAA